MVHLRIVAPDRCAQKALELLEKTESVINIIWLEGAARRPDGHVILCDVAREDASIVISDLCELEIDRDGSIAVEDIDSQISQVSIRAEKAARGMPSDAVVWEEVEARTQENVELSGQFIAFMVLATLLAAIGILTDQLILIIGAMVVGPEFGPLAGLSVALVQMRKSLAKRSLLALAVGFPLSIAASLFFGLLIDSAGLVPSAFSEDQSSFTEFITHPDEFSVLVALLAGMAGVLSLTAAKSGALVGVLISVTTIPAAANIGIALALGDGDAASGATLQLSLNLIAIVAAGVAVLYLQRLLYIRRKKRHLAHPGRKAAGLPQTRQKRADDS